MAVDLECLPPVSPVRAAEGVSRRVQRQVHGGPARATRKLGDYAARPRPSHVSQLFRARRPMALHRSALGEGYLKVESLGASRLSAFRFPPPEPRSVSAPCGPAASFWHHLHRLLPTRVHCPMEAPISHLLSTAADIDRNPQLVRSN